MLCLSTFLPFECFNLVYKRVLVFAGALAFTDLYQGKHMFKCQNEKFFYIVDFLRNFAYNYYILNKGEKYVKFIYLVA